MGPDGFLCVLMDFKRSLWVLIGLYFCVYLESDIRRDCLNRFM